MAPISQSSTLPALEAFGFEFNTTVGALLIGSFVSLFISGITSLQTFTYYCKSKADARSTQITIYTLWFVDTLHSGFYTSATYHYARTLVFNPIGLLRTQWNFSIVLPLGALSDFLVTLIFVQRIWKLSSKGYQPLLFIMIVMTLSVVSFAASLAVLSTSMKVPTYLDFVGKFRWIWYMEFGTRLLVDVMITVALTVILSRQKLKIGRCFSRMNSVLNFLIVYGINTGVFAAIFSVAAILCYALAPMSFIPFAVAELLPKFFLNSLLSLLNSRERMREQVFNGELISIHLSRFSPVGDPLEFPRTICDTTPQTVSTRI